MIKKFPILTQSIFFILSILSLLWPALYNGFPLVYSDSGSYIHSGFVNEIPIDRPIFYGLFLRHFSLATSLWFIVVSQAIFVYFVVYLARKRLVKNTKWPVTFILLSIISFTTGLSNYTSQIMPDFFTGLIILAFGLIATSKTLHLRDYLLVLLFIFGVIVHLSNLIVVFGLLFLVIVYSLYKKKSPRYFARIILICLAPLVIALLVSKNYTDKYQLSRAPNIFIYGRMVETGVMQDFLKENCENNQYIFCTQIDRLPESAVGFIWDDKSLLFDTTCRKIDWTYCWEEKNDALGKSINGLLKSSSHRNKLLKIYSSDFLLQLIDFDIGILTPQKEMSPSYYTIDKYLKVDKKYYTKALQFKKTQEFKTISLIQFIVVILSFLYLLVYMLFLPKIRKLNLFLFITVMGVVGNALTVSFFSTVIDRYQARLIWIIPLMAMLILFSKIMSRNQIEN